MKQVQREVFQRVVNASCGEADCQTSTRTDLRRGVVEKADERVETEVGRPHVDGAKRGGGQEETNVFVLLETVCPTTCFILEIGFRAMTSSERIATFK